MILFYVSGHGFGHATRASAVIDALLEQRPQMEVCVRSEAPAWIFGDRVRFERAAIDPKVSEQGDGLHVDSGATAEALRRFTGQLDQTVASEAAWVRQNGVRLIFADIPFLAGFVGRAAGVPVVAGGNFLWNWILEGHAGTDVIVEGYARCDLALRYPLSHDEGWDVFRRSEQVPLVTPRSRRDRSEIRAELGLQGESRPVVLIGGRTTLAEQGEAGLRDCGLEFAFVRHDALPNYHDLVRASDAVVSKIGYSTVAECIAERKPLLYPPRTGFREDEMLMRSARGLLRSLPIDHAAMRAGDWAGGLRALLALPEPPDSIDTHGAEVCAEILIKTAA